MKSFKKILAFSMALLVMASAFAVNTFAAEFDDYYKKPEFMYGDVDFDNRVSVKDSTAIQKYLAKIITLCEDSIYYGDVDGNEKLTISDATLIQKFVAKMIDVFPAEAPAPDYTVNADGSVLEFDLSTDDNVTIQVNVKEAGYYEMSATTGGETSLFLDLRSEDFEGYWGAQPDGETYYAIMYLEEGTYSSIMFIEEGVDTHISYKVAPTDFEPPFDIASADEIKLGDRIEIKAGTTPLLFKLTLEGNEDSVNVYTEGLNADSVLEVYDERYNLCYFGESDSTISFYGEGVPSVYYILVTQNEGGSDFALCCDTSVDILKKEAKVIKVGSVDECEILELTDDDPDSAPISALARGIYSFTPEKSGYYSLNFRSDSAIEVMGVVGKFESVSDDGYIMVKTGEADERIFDVLYLDTNTEYCIVAMVYIDGTNKVEFSILESDEEEYNKAQEDSFNDDSTAEEYKPVALGETTELSFDSTDDEYYYTFTAEEDMEVVIFSTGSEDACVYIFDENGDELFLGDDIITSVVTNKSIDLFNSTDFAVKGTLSKGETIRLSVYSYTETTDNFTFSIVKAEDYKELF